MPLAVQHNDLLRALSDFCEIGIRTAQVGDVQRLGQIAQAVNLDGAPNAVAGLDIFVACDRTNNNQVVGFVYILVSASATAGFFIKLLCCDPGVQRRGVGSLLMANAFAAMNADTPNRPVSLVVHGTHFPGALTFYDRLGLAVRQAGFPNDLPQNESMVAQNEQAQYQFRVIATPATGLANALKTAKFSNSGTLLANPRQERARTLRFYTNNMSENTNIFFLFRASTVHRAFNQADENNVRVVLTDFRSLRRRQPGNHREVKCVIVKFP